MNFLMICDSFCPTPKTVHTLLVEITYVKILNSKKSQKGKRQIIKILKVKNSFKLTYNLTLKVTKQIIV